MKKSTLLLICFMFILFTASGCNAVSDGEVDKRNIRLRIDGVLMSVAWENNDSVREIKKFLFDKDLIIKTSRYSDFEQVGNMGHSFKTNNKNIKTYPGDIVLYNGNQIVIFYGSNSWSYTKLGRLSSKTQSELKNLLDKSNLTLRFSLSD